MTDNKAPRSFGSGEFLFYPECYVVSGIFFDQLLFQINHHHVIVQGCLYDFDQPFTVQVRPDVFSSVSPASHIILSPGFTRPGRVDFLTRST